MGEHKEKIFANRDLKRIFRQKRDEIIEGSTKIMMATS
jgi:hypothetical protein